MDFHEATRGLNHVRDLAADCIETKKLIEQAQSPGGVFAELPATWIRGDSLTTNMLHLLEALKAREAEKVEEPASERLCERGECRDSAQWSVLTTDGEQHKRFDVCHFHFLPSFAVSDSAEVIRI